MISPRWQFASSWLIWNRSEYVDWPSYHLSYSSTFMYEILHNGHLLFPVYQKIQSKLDMHKINIRDCIYVYSITIAELCGSFALHLMQNIVEHYVLHNHIYLLHGGMSHFSIILHNHMASPTHTLLCRRDVSLLLSSLILIELMRNQITSWTFEWARR